MAPTSTARALLIRGRRTAINRFIVGTRDKTSALAPDGTSFLLIDHGPTADAFAEAYKRAKIFDTTRGLNPLPMNEIDARDFARIIFGSEGKDTLTVRNGRRALVRMLMTGKRFDKLHGTKSDADKEALAAIDDMLLSPTLRKMFRKNTPRWFTAGPPIIARIDPSVIGDDAAYLLGNILMAIYPDQLIVREFDFYARDAHVRFIRQKRLIAGVERLSDLPEKLRKKCLTMPTVGLGCVYPDAVELAQNARLRPDPLRENNTYEEYIDMVMA